MTIAEPTKVQLLNIVPARKASMKISIEFCNQWGYRPRAVSLAAKVEKQFDVKVEMIPSSGGVFEVVADDKLIYSKKATGVFPGEGNVMDLLQQS